MLYCGPKSGVFSYVPMYLSKEVGLRRPAIRILPFGNTTSAIPVMRFEDSLPIPFYYHASGCSDMFLHANRSNGLVVYDRIDAIFRLSSTRHATKMLSQWCNAELHRYSLAHIPRAIFPSSATTTTSSLQAVRSLLSGSGCLNTPIYQAMRNRGIDTLVLNFEHPGGDMALHASQRKTEIIHIGNRLFDAHGEQCQIKSFDGCLYCKGSVLSLATCNGTLGRIVTSTKRRMASLRQLRLPPDPRLPY